MPFDDFQKHLEINSEVDLAYFGLGDISFNNGEMIEAIESGNTNRANELDAILQPLFDVLFITSNPIPVKAALKLIGFNCGTTRPPLMSITNDQQSDVETIVDAFFEKV